MTTRKFMAVLLFILSLVACDDGTHEPYLNYESHFDSNDIDTTVNKVKHIADRWDLRVFEKNRENMSRITRNNIKAFYIALYLEDSPLLDITNVGVGDKLILSLFKFDNISYEELDNLASEMLSELSKEGINMKPSQN